MVPFEAQSPLHLPGYKAVPPEPGGLGAVATIPARLQGARGHHVIVLHLMILLILILCLAFTSWSSR